MVHSSEHIAEHQAIEQELVPVLEGTGTAVRESKRRQSAYRPATVLEVSVTRDSVLVLDDGDPEAKPFGATLIAPTAVLPNDRVMVHYYPPHGATIVGVLRGSYMPWRQVTSDTITAPGNFNTGWGNTATFTGPLDGDTFAWVAYRRVQGMVELRGRATRTSGASSVVFRLPGDFCPRNNLVFTTVAGPTSGVSFSLVQVNWDGDVEALLGTLDSPNGFIQFDGIYYSME